MSGAFVNLQQLVNTTSDQILQGSDDTPSRLFFKRYINNIVIVYTEKVKRYKQEVQKAQSFIRRVNAELPRLYKLTFKVNHKLFELESETSKDKIDKKGIEERVVALRKEKFPRFDAVSGNLAKFKLLYIECLAWLNRYSALKWHFDGKRQYSPILTEFITDEDDILQAAEGGILQAAEEDPAAAVQAPAAEEDPAAVQAPAAVQSRRSRAVRPPPVAVSRNPNEVYIYNEENKSFELNASGILPDVYYLPSSKYGGYYVAYRNNTRVVSGQYAGFHTVINGVLTKSNHPQQTGGAEDKAAITVRILNNFKKCIAVIQEIQGGDTRQQIRDEVAQIILNIGSSVKMSASRQFLNICITGSPGIGKTMLSEVLAKVYTLSGLLCPVSGSSADSFVDNYTVKDFVGQYVGETANKTYNLLLNGLERVTFCDEAYTFLDCGNDGELKEGTSGGNQYGKEAIGEMLAFLDTYRGLSVVIVAGYKDKMFKCFFGANPGLERRFPNILSLEQFKPEDLVSIFNVHATPFVENNRHLHIRTDIIEDFIRRADPEMFRSQAGDILTLFKVFEKVLHNFFSTATNINAKDYQTLQAMAVREYLKTYHEPKKDAAKFIAQRETMIAEINRLAENVSDDALADSSSVDEEDVAISPVANVLGALSGKNPYDSKTSSSAAASSSDSTSSTGGAKSRKHRYRSLPTHSKRKSRKALEAKKRRSS